MKFEEQVIRYARAIIICTAIAVGLAIIPILNSRINSDLESYIPGTMNSRANTEKIEKIFGDNEPVVIIFESEDVLNRKTLQRLQDLSSGFEATGAFSAIYSLADAKSIKGEDGFLIVEPIIGEIPETEEETEELRRRIMEEDLAYGLVVSEEFRYTMMMLKSGRILQDDELMKLVEETLEMYPGSEKVYINAMPFLRNEAGNRISKDLLLLLPLGLMLMFIFLRVSFREWRGVLLPMLVVLISIIISMALIPLFGWEITIISVLIPVMMIAIANNYGIHFISKYQEINASGGKGTMNEIVAETIAYLGKPVLFTGLTTIAGVLGLATHILIPASRMGVISAISIGIALILSLTLIPGIMIFLKKSGKHHDYTKSKISPVIRVLDVSGSFVSLNPKLVVVFFGIFLMLAASGLMRFRPAADSNNVLPSDHSFNTAARLADDHFGGTKILNLLFRGDVREPEMMKRLDKYEKTIGSIEGIGSVSSIATVIRKMSIALNEKGDEYYDRIPDTYEAISQYIELYNMNGDPEDLEEFVDFNFEHALMTIQYRAGDIEHVRRVIGEMESMVKDDPGYMAMGGFSLIDKELSEAVLLGQKYSLIFAFTVIFVLMWLIYRSWKAGVMGSIPLFFAVVSTFGLMGWLDIELNIVTALMSSVSIGLGVDFTIHIFWRIRKELLSGSTYVDSVRVALRTTGRGISINAVSVVLGFSVLFLSAFPIIRSFAFLIIISLIFCLLCAMLLIPALCILLKPGFLMNNYNK